MKNAPEIKTFEKSMKSGGTPQKVSRSTTSKIKSSSESPKKGVVVKTSKIIHKAAKLPAKKQPMLSKRKSRKTRI